MSHEPPVPPGNQSPYPIEEPPHHHAPETSGTPSADGPIVKAPDRPRKTSPGMGDGVLGAIAVISVAAVVAAGAWAYASRPTEAAGKKGKAKRKPDKR